MRSQAIRLYVSLFLSVPYKPFLLISGCIYEIGDFLLYSSRIKAMASQNFVGKGPTKEILDLRENRKAMERIKQQFMSQAELDELFEYLGIKVSKKNTGSRKKIIKPGAKRPFAISDIEDVEQALKKFKPDPKAPYTYKTPKVKDPLNSKRPGRPKGTKKKRPSKNDSLSSETSIEMSDIETIDSDESFDHETDVDSKQTGRQLRNRKHLTQSVSKESFKSTNRKNSDTNMIEDDYNELELVEPEDDIQDDHCIDDSNEHGSQNVCTISRKERFAKSGPNNDEIDKPTENESYRTNEPEKDNGGKQTKDKSKWSYQCSLCNEPSKKIEGVRAHFIVEHAWEKYENSPVMIGNIEDIENIFAVDFMTGRFKCACGEVCPAAIMNNGNNEEENDCFGRRWVLVHRLVDSRHYQPSKTHRLTEVFPKDLILFNGLPWTESKLDESTKTSSEISEPTDIINESLSEHDLSLPDIEKYSKVVSPTYTDEEIDEFSSDDDNYSDEEYSPTYEEDDGAKASSKDENKFSNPMAKKDRKKDTKSFQNLRKRAKAEAHNYTLKLKCEKSDSFTFEVWKARKSDPYTVTFDERDVTCNCKSFRDIEERKYTSANEVCKHVALITLHCHDNLRENFHGQRWFSTRGAFGRVSEMLRSFDPTRNILERPKHPNFSLYPPPIPNPSRKFPYFKKKKYAIFQMKKLVTPKWVAEKYNRDTNQGDKPSCKVCNRKIALGNLCLRVDYTSVFVNRNFRSDEFSLRMAPFRICMKISCFKDLNLRFVPRKKYREETNLPSIENIYLQNIFDNDKTTVNNLFQFENVVLDNVN